MSLVQRTLSKGPSAEGASCIISFTCPNTPVTDETMYQKISRESSTLTGIRNFVKVCGQHLSQMTFDELKEKSEPFRFVTQSVTKETFEVKFLATSYTYAVAVQEMAKRDPKWKSVATVSVQHAMSIDAPTFKPNFASSSLSPVRMPVLNPNENTEILK